ncbi:hypothetical protein ACFWIB_38930 [Streptomyces sp. NPDC127051]|uniref:hypothetical protein n=1 Tax=Streptomyces sp. NPDC127051 TaxID=3347119 RepID=UPI0036580C88
MKTTSRKTKSGTVRYLHLAHNTWDAAAGRSVPKLLYGFGREDQLDTDAVRRLVGSLSKLLDPAAAPCFRRTPRTECAQAHRDGGGSTQRR